MASAPELSDLEQRTLATERLLGTLIALLSARDPRLLHELQAIFADPDFATDAAGRAASETWDRIAAELQATGLLIGSMGKASASGGQKVSASGHDGSAKPSDGPTSQVALCSAGPDGGQIALGSCSMRAISWPVVRE